MSKENEQVDEELEEIEDSDTTDWKTETYKLREKAIRQRDKTKELRSKISEYESKLEEFEKQKPEKGEKKSDEEVLKRLEKMALKMSNITADDEVELYERWKQETGRDADSILGNNIFEKELGDLRTTKANIQAADVKGGDGKDSTGKSDPDFWIAKATKDSNGELLFPDNMPNDPKLHTAIVEKMVGSAKSNKQFYNQ